MSKLTLLFWYLILIVLNLFLASAALEKNKDRN